MLYSVASLAQRDLPCTDVAAAVTQQLSSS